MGTHIFIWEQFAPVHSSGLASVGLAFAIADTESQARQYIIDKLGYDPSDWGPCDSYCLAEVSEIAGAVTGGG